MLVFALPYDYLLAMLLRVRVTSFLAGFGLAGALSLLQIRQDLLKSHEFLKHQAEEYSTALESRIALLEAQVSQLQPASERQAPAPAPNAQ